MLTGLVVVSVLDPGGRIDPNFVHQARQEGAHEVSNAIEAGSAQAQGPPSIGAILKSLVLMLFTDNLLQSMVRMDLLPLIAFSIVFAGMLTTMGQRSETVANLVVSINDALMSFILLLMRIAPLGIFCLVAARFGKAQADGKFLALLQVQLGYILTVLSGLAIHGLVTLPLIYYAVTRKNPIGSSAACHSRCLRPSPRPARQPACRSRWSVPRQRRRSPAVRSSSCCRWGPRSI